MSCVRFDSQALKSGKPVIVDFAADWCPDCQQMAPVLLDLKQQVGNVVEFVTLHVTYAAPGWGHQIGQAG